MEHPQQENNGPTIIPAAIVSVILSVLVFWSFESARVRPSSIILPAGGTYLGPTPTKSPETAPSIRDTPPALTSEIIPIPTDAAWTKKTGSIFPYSFMVPDTLSLGLFPNDPYDSVTVFYKSTDSGNNIFFRVENLDTLKKSEYKGKIRQYADTWWKSYVWKGVTKITKFTNAGGLTGYRATYTTDSGPATYDHVFFEVPGRPELVIWLSGRLFERSVFDRIVDSVNWKK